MKGSILLLNKVGTQHDSHKFSLFWLSLLSFSLSAATDRFFLISCLIKMGPKNLYQSPVFRCFLNPLQRLQIIEYFRELFGRDSKSRGSNVRNQKSRIESQRGPKQSGLELRHWTNYVFIARLWHIQIHLQLLIRSNESFYIQVSVKNRQKTHFSVFSREERL